MKAVNDHGAFSGSHLVYMCSRSGDLVLGRWIIRLANERPDGDLVIVASIQVCETLEDIAFVDIGAQALTNMVSSTQTAGFRAFLENLGFKSSSLSVLSHKRLTETDFRRSATVLKADAVPHTQGIEVHADVIRIFGSYEQPILKLYRAREGSVMPALSDADLSRNLTNRGVHFNDYEGPETENSMLKPLKDDRAPSSVTGSDSKSGVFASRLAMFQKASSRHTKLLALTLLVTVVMSIATPSLIVVFVNKFTVDLDQKVSEINSIGLRRFLSITAAVNSRELMLISSHHGSYWNETRAREQLCTVATNMQSMRNSLENSIADTNGLYRDYLLDGEAPYWEWTGKDFALFEVTLINLMSKFAQSAAVLNATKVDEVTKDNGDFLTLFRNGPSESLHVFNTTLNLYIHDAQVSWQQNETVLGVLVYVSMTVLCSLALCAIIPVIVLAERKRKQIWVSLLAFSAKEISTLRFKASERLTDIHGLEDAKNISAVENDGSSTNYQMSGTMKLLVGAIGLYLSCVCIVLFLIYTIGATQPADLLFEKPYYMHWSGYRRAMVLISEFWMREVWLQSTDVSYFQTIQKDGYAVEPREEWGRALSELEAVHRGLSYGNKDLHLTKFVPSDVHKELLQGDACTDCPPFGQKGLTPLLFELADAQHTAIDCFDSPQSDYQLCGGIHAESLISSALPLLSASINLFDSDSSAELSASVSLITIMTIAFAVFSVVVYGGVFYPLIRKVRDRQNAKHWKEEMNVMNFLPKDKVVDVLITSARPGNEDGFLSKRD